MTISIFPPKPLGHTGMGMMMMTLPPHAKPLESNIALLKKAFELGATFWNAAIFYGTPDYNSLHVLREYFTRYPEDASKIVLSVKIGMDFSKQTHGGVRAEPGFIREQVRVCESMLKGLIEVAVYAVARTDPDVSIEDSVGAIIELQNSGEISASIGLSECGPDTIRRVSKITKVSCVEVEFSMFAPDILTNGVVSTCAELQIPIIAYSPLSRGFLTGQIRKFEDIPEGDYRRSLPRFQPDVFPKHMRLVDEVEKLAAEKGCKATNIAMAWVKAHEGRPGMPPTVLPIPGATRVASLTENMVDVRLTDEEFEELNKVVKECEYVGPRYAGALADVEFA